MLFFFFPFEEDFFHHLMQMFFYEKRHKRQLNFLYLHRKALSIRIRKAEALHILHGHYTNISLMARDHVA